MAIVDFNLEGKVALVTGGSRGIGRMIALALAENGADVVVSSRKLPDLEAVAEEIKATGRKGLAVSSHIAKVEESQNLIDTVKKDFGRLDILVNNAGTNPFLGPLMDAEEWVWDVTMNVNLKGPFLLSQMAARVMKDQGGGNIINIASTAGLNPSMLHIYSVTKAALIMLTRVMAMEWGKHNIRANAIAPGMIKTKFSEALWKGTPAEDALPPPEDICGAALYLASDASKSVQGETIVVSGSGK
ncbi:MAG TPA: glucose 1-dehydrogenase [Dehalococcoidia bacterium]|nr:glucose 1-dehydrogenase [Dehalococcoidia bacterium]